MKKSRLLPETDLARTALLPDDQKRIVLRSVKSFRPPHSFGPLRKVVPALYQARASMFDLPKRAWTDVENAIRTYCGTNAHWVEPNLSVAEALFEFNENRGHKAIEWEFPFIPVGFGSKIKFWHDVYSIQDDRPVLAFVDPRRTDGLSVLGRLFIFSAMHHQFAVGDFEGAQFEILRFPLDQFTGKRKVEVFKFNESDVIDLPTLNEAIDRTFKIWREILAERTEEMRRHRSTGTDDDFGF